MHKRVKKLSLNRETLRHLQVEQLGKVVGGNPTTSRACDEASGCACDSRESNCACLPPSACFGTCSCSG